MVGARDDVDRFDLHNDAALAFGPRSLKTGAILPYEGRTLLMGSNGPPVSAIEADADGWLSPNNPVLVRGRARILPLAWRGDPHDGYQAQTGRDDIAAFAARMQSAGTYWAGNGRALEGLGDDQEPARPGDDSVGTFVAALRAAGATRADVWRYSEAVGIALVWAGDESEGTASLALHLVPASWVSAPPDWVSKRRAREWRPVRELDLRWSWADVIELNAARSGAGVQS